MIVNTRFAPSPTGNIHLGNIRTALYAWLFSKKNNGNFFLRIDDTNKKNIKKKYINNILHSMKWLNLDFNGKINFQSKNIFEYEKKIDYLLENNYAYKCYCTKHRLNKLKKYQIKNNIKIKYDGYCRKNKNILFKNNKKYVIRIKNPLTGLTSFKDLLRGKISINNLYLNDFVIKRNNGTYTYNFCSVIDDINMNITHVIRGDEHINNTFKQINIIKYLNIKKIPKYIHLPIIKDSNNKKISKKNNTIFDILYLRSIGFIPESIINFLFKLNYSYKNKEIFNIKEMKYYFDIYKISKSQSIININKLYWFNSLYIKSMPIKKIIFYFKKYLKINKLTIDNNKLSYILNILKYRCKTFNDMIINYNFLFFLKKNILFDKNIINYLSKKYVVEFLYNFKIYINNYKYKFIYNKYFYLNTILYKLSIKLLIDINLLKNIFRIIITGKNKSLPLINILNLIKYNIMLNRIEYFLKLILNK